MGTNPNHIEITVKVTVPNYTVDSAVEKVPAIIEALKAYGAIKNVQIRKP
jgi:hypothetical protein